MICAAPRIIPHALTQWAPGDLFVMRNVGNMVPLTAADRSAVLPEPASNTPQRFSASPKSSSAVTRTEARAPPCTRPRLRKN
ncbi:carbonic anhydrase [Aromatoleum evansii]|uniref:carbonic anhydrase n=1 Tax=Aromatoleum evansii TaxID=59406 RepID=UPI0034E0C75F